VRPHSTADRRLIAALIAFLEAVELGISPDVEGLASAYPDVAVELREYAAGYAQIEKLIAPLRLAAATISREQTQRATGRQLPM
jgi:hypothetical protein